jgi:uncharacterized protein (UPF0548 family)
MEESVLVVETVVLEMTLQQIYASARYLDVGNVDRYGLILGGLSGRMTLS